MHFSLNRRYWVIILLVATSALVILLTHRPFTSSNVTIAQTPTIGSTPVPDGTPTSVETQIVTPEATLAAQNSDLSPTETPEPMPDIATSSDVINIKKIRSNQVEVKNHVIEQGENYWTIAKKANLDVYSLIGANPDLPFKAIYHQNILLMSKKGVLHTVRSGETLTKIAEKYRTTENAIKDANGLHWWHPAQSGDVLFIPGARPVLMTLEWKDYFSKRGLFGVPFSRWATWTSGFGLRIDPFTGKHKEHTGVDLRAKYGDPVYASAPGKVIFTGIAGGYGNLIQIAHGHGYVTYYGHLSKIYAQVGQKVRRGTLIGRVGATGRVTGPHLHFEIRLKGKPLDPLQFI